MKIAIFALTLATPALAQDYVIRSSDTIPTRSALLDMILDRDLEYYDGGSSRYSSDGTYAWTFGDNNGGATLPGIYAVGDNATICITYDTGSQRCDMFVFAADRLVLLSEDGHRYPVRRVH